MGNDDVDVSELEQRQDVPGLIEALQNPDEGVRRRAADALGRVGDERALPALTKALADPAATDPADLFSDNPAWQEMGSEELIYYVREAAWDAHKMIRSRTRTPPDPTPVEPVPGKDPFEVGDIVMQYRSFPRYALGGSARAGPERGMEDTKWRVKAITRNEVTLELVDGVYERPEDKRRWHLPGYVLSLGRSDDFSARFPRTNAKNVAFATYRKVKERG